jgi:phosphonate transport system substrate-binding protein
MNKINIFFIFILFLLTSCFSGDKYEIVDFKGPAPATSSISFHEDEAIHVGIASIISPKETFTFYNDLLAFISQKLEMPIHYLQKESYQEINDLLKIGAVDFAFVGAGAYVEAKKNNIARLLVAPVSNHQNKYKAFIIVHKSSRIRTFMDLKGKNFTYTDPLSNSGFNFIIAKIKDMGLDETKFFSKTIFSYSNDLSCELVNRRVMDGASISSQVYSYLKQNSPEKIKNLKIIEESGYFPTPPVVVPANIDEKKLKLYKNIFLNLHKDPIGKEILEKVNINYFIDVSDSEYSEVKKLSKRAGE